MDTFNGYEIEAFVDNDYIGVSIGKKELKRLVKEACKETIKDQIKKDLVYTRFYDDVSQVFMRPKLTNKKIKAKEKE